MQLTVSAIFELQSTGKTEMYFDSELMLAAKQSLEKSSSNRKGKNKTEAKHIPYPERDGVLTTKLLTPKKFQF